MDKNMQFKIISQNLYIWVLELIGCSSTYSQIHDKMMWHVRIRGVKYGFYTTCIWVKGEFQLVRDHILPSLESVLHLQLLASSDHNQSHFFCYPVPHYFICAICLSHPPLVCAAQLCFASLSTLFCRASSLLWSFFLLYTFLAWLEGRLAIKK